MKGMDYMYYGTKKDGKKIKYIYPYIKSTHIACDLID